MDRERTGGGAIVEYGIHTIDLARWIMDEIASVCATSRTWIPERPLRDESGSIAIEVDDSTAWLMEFVNGAIGVCHAGWATAGRPPGLDVRVFGSAGAARCVIADDIPGDEGLWLAGTDGKFYSAEIPTRFSELIPDSGAWWSRLPAHLIRCFVAEITAGVSAEPTFADGVSAQQVLEAMLTAANERHWVDLPL
jgi:predicted dehydrogenase